MRTWTVGAVTISQIVEQIIPEGLPGFLPDATPEALLAIPWLYPEFITQAGEPSLSVHAFILDTPTKRILVDTCIGNDKDLKISPIWNQMQTDFLSKMNAAGFSPESIDVVVCTHLHLDHVGWNTMLVDGLWQPTFGNARYLFGRLEYEHMQSILSDPEEDEAWRECNAAVERESVQPVLDAGLVDLVEFHHVITDEVSLTPTIGHTPGHVSILIRSGGAEAIITGDAVHHPCQLAHPEWGAVVDADGDQSRRTRLSMFTDAVERRRIMLGTHWTGAGGGTLVPDGVGFRLEFDPTVDPTGVAAASSV
ncbi:MBL fold metallo-hydrolase [Sphingobium lactosutens]|nr:MBL fold metallo-hydrolase [Sphingobium lactosutens]